MSASVMSRNMKALQRFNPTELGLTGGWREIPLSASDVSGARIFDRPGGYVKHDLIFPKAPVQVVEDNLNKWQRNMVQDLQKNNGRRGTITSAPIGMKSPFWSSDKKSWKSSNGFVNLDAEPIVMATPPKQESTPPTPAISNNYATLAQAEKAATTAVASGDGGEAQRKAIEQARQKRNRYHDRKVSLRNADTVSIHSMRRPLVPQRPTAIIASTSGLGPLSQWQLTGENYIDSDMRKRHRAAIGSRRSDDHTELTKENRRVMYNGPHGTWETSHSGESSSTSSTPNSLTSSMADVEKPLRKPREERSTVFDRTVRIPRKKLVLDGPLHSTSYAHWNSQVFPRPETD